MHVRRFVCEYAKVVNPNIKVIGSAGSKEKCELLKKIGVDVAINYKEQDTEAVLREHGPIDMYVHSRRRPDGMFTPTSVTGTMSPERLLMQRLST